jgi:Secretion system C-terminal sorting domain
MKHLYKILLLVISPIIINAQPTITAAGINGAAGETYGFASGPYIFPGNAGANQFWDFSTATSTASGTFTYLLPANTPFPAFSPSSNMCASNTINGNTIYNFYTQTAVSNQLNAYAFGNTPAQNGTYSDTFIGLTFPFTFGNTSSDTYKLNYFLSSTVTAVRTGSITASADAYGTIITPLDTFFNVLRISSANTYNDTIFNGASISVINYISYNIAWYLDGIHTSVFTVSSTQINGASNFSSTHLTSLPSFLEKNLPDQFNISLSPNPTTGVLRISSDKQILQYLTIKDVSGKRVLVNDFTALKSNTTDVNVSQLNKGVYVVEIKTNNGVVKKRMVKE